MAGLGINNEVVLRQLEDNIYKAFYDAFTIHLSAMYQSSKSEMSDDALKKAEDQTKSLSVDFAKKISPMITEAIKNYVMQIRIDSTITVPPTVVAATAMGPAPCSGVIVVPAETYIVS